MKTKGAIPTMSQRLQLLLELILFGALGWLGAAWRVTREQLVSRDGTRRFDPLLILLEMPGALACGIIGAGLGKYLFDVSDPMVLAAFAVAAGKVGSEAITEVFVSWLSKRRDKGDLSK